ncbi:hypothetical protein C2I18_26095 [Paenibacillus sp. PK3_47]|uniref:hypothetical protein n=1 Tax=Paenibacillus sp. PK3_47 TaxID=2072642 RepID=UPI00201D4069|nr:hypothetical protein [Paenibacillus sp. PK3_47]UQZ36697.1 hypothetical protein C2I18_26095 [Paenibacillus sp. PK3_47]
MDIKWINEDYKEAGKIFDSIREVNEWADSLYPDFAGGLRVHVGYASPDANVHTYLAEHLPQWADYNNVRINVNTSKELINGIMIYKIWVTPFEDQDKE